MRRTRGRRVSTSTLRRIGWHGYFEYRGTLTTVVVDLDRQVEVVSTFDAYFSSVVREAWPISVDLRVMNQRPA